MIRVKRKIQFVSGVLPACLQTDIRDEHPDVNLTITGWGITDVESTIFFIRFGQI